eukprot:1601815-Pleurochrysis_carterae.AAC.11
MHLLEEDRDEARVESVDEADLGHHPRGAAAKAGSKGRLAIVGDRRYAPSMASTRAVQGTRARYASGAEPSLTIRIGMDDLAKRGGVASMRQEQRGRGRTSPCQLRRSGLTPVGYGTPAKGGEDQVMRAWLCGLKQGYLLRHCS